MTRYLAWFDTDDPVALDELGLDEHSVELATGPWLVVTAATRS